MSPKKPPRPVKPLGSALFVLAGFVLGMAGCQSMTLEEGQAYFRVDGDSTWREFSRFLVVLASPEGQVVDTLYNDSISDLAVLTRLHAPHYRGGRVLIGLYGYRGEGLSYSQGREFDGETQRVLAIYDSLPPLQGSTLALAYPVKQGGESDGDSAGPITAPTDTGSDSGGEVPPEGNSPKVLRITGDSLVSINDKVALEAQIHHGGSRILFAGWDFEADGRFDDSAAASLQGPKFTAAPKYSKPGFYTCVFRLRTAVGQAEAKFAIEVTLDPPVADAGEDTVVVVGTAINLHAKGSDRFGPIAKREWKIGGEDFKPVMQQETRIMAPLEAMDLQCVLRITDNDGLAALDTMVVRVVE